MTRLRYLFFVERDLHIPVLEPLWQAVMTRNLGDAGIYSLPGVSLPRSLFPSVASSDPAKSRPGLQIVPDPRSFMPDVTVLADHSYHLVEGLGRLVHVGHGIISKGYYFLPGGRGRRENLADLHCVPGMVHKRQLQQSVFKPVEATGMPKLDQLDRIHYDKPAEMVKLGLNPDWPTLLMAPTFNPELSLLPHLPDDIRKVIPEETNLLIKLHGETSQRDSARIRAFVKGDRFSVLINEQDITPYFPLADVLLTDVSSVMFEFLYLRKPVILFDSPTVQSFPQYDPKNLEYQYRQAGIRVSEAGHIRMALIKALQMPFMNAQKIRTAQAFLPARGSSSSDRVLQAIARLVQDHPRTNVLVLFHGSKQQAMPDRLLRLGEEFTIRFVQTHEFETFPWKEIQTHVNSFNGQIVIYLREGFEYSACFFQALLAHFQYQKKLGCLTPLYCGKESASYVQPWSLGVQLGYEFCGESDLITEIHPSCFACPTSLIKRFFTVHASVRMETFHALPDFVQGSHFEIRLGMDLLMFDPDRLESWDERGNPVGEPQTLFMNLDGLASSHHPRNLIEMMVKAYKRCNRTWTTAKQIHLLVELAATHAKRGRLEQALKLLQEARNEDRHYRNRPVTVRMYYYIAFALKGLGFHQEARRFLKACLKLAPDHRKARALLDSPA